MDPQTTSPLFVHPGDLTEPIFWLLPVGVALAAAATCVFILVRGKASGAIASAGIVFLPVVTVALTGATLMDRSKKTGFCISCHVMEPVHRSTLADDGSIASFHVSEGAVPRATSCYSCHSGYGIWGNVGAKRAGFNHMIHTVLGSYDLPLTLRGPYDIDGCLQCHAETRAFRQAGPHRVAEIQEALLRHEMSCTGTCHPAAHPPEALTGG